MNSSILMQLTQQQGESAISLSILFEMLSHSIVLGIILVLANYFGSQVIDNLLRELTPEKQAKATIRDIVGSSNLLFLCAGLTGIMLLINNSVFRAFAIVSAIALIKFRVKIDNKGLNGSLLFAVLSGMACGVQELLIAWIVVGFYIMLVAGLIMVIKYFHMPSEEKHVLASEAIKHL